ncbi:unnamed protein product [Linum tenue]|nr:unnamed protein product [Linum tenue]
MAANNLNNGINYFMNTTNVKAELGNFQVQESKGAKYVRNSYFFKLDERKEFTHQVTKDLFIYNEMGSQPIISSGGSMQLLCLSSNYFVSPADSCNFLQNYYVSPLLNKVYNLDQYGSFLVSLFNTFVKGSCTWTMA